MAKPITEAMVTKAMKLAGARIANPTARAFALTPSLRSYFEVDVVDGFDPEKKEHPGVRAMREGFTGTRLLLDESDLAAARWGAHELANRADDSGRGAGSDVRAFYLCCSQQLTKLADTLRDAAA